MEKKDIIISVKVTPQSKKPGVEDFTLNENGTYSLKVRVTAPALDGKANEAVIDALSTHLKVRKSDIEIIKGHTNRQKLIKVYNAATIMAQQTLILG
jgi:uncharacterized protein (TIGR00251 family)